MSFSLVGSAYGDGYPSMGTTLSVSPTTIGNWFIVSFFCSYPYPAYLVGGGGVTTWTQIEGDQTHGYSSGTWIGQITATGPQTITFSSGYLYICAIAQEFSVIGTPTFDTSAIVDDPGAGTASSGNFPSVTSTSSNELFAGFCAQSYNSVLSTSTPGYTYTATYPPIFHEGGFAVFNTSVSGTQSPNWAATNPTSGTFVSVLLIGGSEGSNSWMIL